MQYRSLVLLCVLLLYSVDCQDPEEELIKRIIQNCIQSKSKLACFADKAARALEKSIDWDIPLFDGVNLARNDVEINPYHQQARAYKSTFERFTQALANFLNTHTVSVDFTRDDNQFKGRKGDGGGGYGGGGGGGGGGSKGGGGGTGFGIDKKALKKEKKYMQYAFMVLLGIFGLTGPIIMKTLAVMAAKALIASKAALIIVGSVALKKIFEKDNDKPQVKVHTVTEHDDDHDRIYSNKQTPYWAWDPYNPYTKSP